MNVVFKNLCIAVLFFFAVSALPSCAAHRAETGGADIERGYGGAEPSSFAVFADVAIARPLGLVATVLGSCLFVVGLPFTVPTSSVGISAKKLVAEPFDYTFKRPIGQGLEGFD